MNADPGVLFRRCLEKTSWLEVELGQKAWRFYIDFMFVWGKPRSAFIRNYERQDTWLDNQCSLQNVASSLLPLKSMWTFLLIKLLGALMSLSMSASLTYDTDSATSCHYRKISDSYIFLQEFIPSMDWMSKEQMSHTEKGSAWFVHRKISEWDFPLSEKQEIIWRFTLPFRQVESSTLPALLQVYTVFLQ